MSKQNLDDLKSKISRSFEMLSPNFRRIASFLLEHPDEVAICSTRQIASQLGMDPSNLVRFAQEFAFSGFSELRALFQEQFRQSQTGYLERAHSLQNQNEEGVVDSLHKELYNSNISNIENVFRENDHERLSSVSASILNAKNVYICGFRSCFSAAFSLYYSCRMLRDGVHLSDGLGGTLADDIRNIGKDDLLVAIATQPYSNSTLASTRYAERFGAKIIALTDSHLSPLTASAEVVLTFSRNGPLVLGSITPAVALVEAVISIMIAKGGEAAIEKLQDTEKQLSEFAAYSDQAAPDAFNPANTKAK